MPKRAGAPSGAPCWVDLITSDIDKSLAFYGELFGWTDDGGNQEFGGYTSWTKNGLPVAGCMPSRGGEGPSDMWSVYLATDDADKIAEAAAAHGGSVMIPPMKVSEAGTMTFLKDAGNAPIGVWQPGEHKGFELVGEPGAPSWFELSALDYEASVRFYEQVFNWDTHPMDAPGMRYTTLGEGPTAMAGIMDATGVLPEGVPPHWTVYFDVADADAAMAQIVTLGGAVLSPPDDTPYGRLVNVADVNGAQFKIRGNA